MYETMMHTLRSFMGSGLMGLALFLALVLITMVLAAWSSASFRESVARLRAAGGRRAILADLGAGLFKLAVLCVVARLFICVLNYQAGIFEHEHGRITERNRSAVLMKWGLPHEQRELKVNHTRKRTQVTRQLLLVEDHDGKPHERIISETYWKDQDRPIQPVNGQLPTLLSAAEEPLDVPVPQKSIVSADVSIGVTDDPRRLGNANYAGYDDDWKLTYLVANKSPYPTDAHLVMPLPAETGIFDRMFLRVDGQDLLETAGSSDEGIAWTVPMSPGEQKRVDFGYRSRGLEHLRYIPRRMSQTGHYRVAMEVKGIAPAKLDYPIGSMPPTEDLTKLQGDSYTLTWNLDNAMTSYDIGIKLPVAEQPQYHFAHLLAEAPAGLLLLLVLLVLPAVLSGEPVRLEIITVLTALYCLHYTLMGRLADVIDGFTAPFLISGVTTLALVWWFRTRRGARDFLSRQDPAAFAVMALLYPLAMIDPDRSSLWMVLLLFAMTAYGCVLLVRGRRRKSG